MSAKPALLGLVFGAAIGCYCTFIVMITHESSRAREARCEIREEIQQETYERAAAKGYGDFQVDPMSGEIKFVWKKSE